MTAGGHREAGKKASIVALFADLGTSIAKLVGPAFTGAASMLAEAVHSVVDTGKQGVLPSAPNRAARSGS